MNVKILENLSFIHKVYYYKEIPSTNELAKELLPAKDFTIIIAESQTKGKGRNKREWFSPLYENLYFSFILNINDNINKFSPYPLIVAYSIFLVIKKYLNSKNIFIKWPNDIYVENRKISGILIEIIDKFLITGIGININTKKFPEFKENVPTSLFIESGKKFNRESILIDFFKIFKNNLKLFYENYLIPEEILNNINKNLKYKNEFVKVIFNKNCQKGKVSKINEKGYLVLDNCKSIYAGDVIKLKKL